MPKRIITTKAESKLGPKVISISNRKGGVVGYGIGSLTVKLNNALPINISIEPLISKGIAGTALSVSF